MNAYLGHKSHVKQIIQGKKELLDPPQTAEQYDSCQVIDIKTILQTMVKDDQLTISKEILFEVDEIFNPRRINGDVSVFVEFTYR